MIIVSETSEPDVVDHNKKTDKKDRSYYWLLFYRVL